MNLSKQYNECHGGDTLSFFLSIKRISFFLSRKRIVPRNFINEFSVMAEEYHDYIFEFLGGYKFFQMIQKPRNGKADT